MVGKFFLTVLAQGQPMVTFPGRGSCLPICIPDIKKAHLTVSFFNVRAAGIPSGSDFVGPTGPGLLHKHSAFLGCAVERFKMVGHAHTS